MRAFLLPFLLLGAVLIGACKHAQPFVKPVAASVNAQEQDTAAAKSEDGYLRIFVSSNLDTTGKALNFGDKEERPALLLISARFGRGTVASFAADTNAEIPVLLYDIQGAQTLTSVVDNALLTEGMLIDPESLSKSPHLQILVRGVPLDKARWVTNLLEVATAEPVLRFGMSFVPGASAVTNLSTRLGDLLSEEIKSTNKPWEERTLLGLRPDQGLYSLDGRQFVVLLNSTTMELQQPPRLARCDPARSSTGLCLPDGSAWHPQQAYVRFELDVTDYRSIRDFIGTGVSCESDERTWSEYRALLASGQLARKQTQYERDLLARGDLLLAARRAQSEFMGSRYAGRMLQLAQHLALLATPDDAYWRQHYQARAQALESCVRTEAVRGQTQYASIWDSATRLFAQSRNYPAWSAALQANADPEAGVLRQAEQELLRVQQLMRLPDVHALDAQSQDSLLALDQQLQQMLLASYRRVIETQVGTALTPQQSEEALRTLAAHSACEACRLLISARADVLAAEAAQAAVEQAAAHAEATAEAAREAQLEAIPVPLQEAEPVVDSAPKQEAESDGQTNRQLLPPAVAQDSAVNSMTPAPAPSAEDAAASAAGPAAAEQTGTTAAVPSTAPDAAQ